MGRVLERLPGRLPEKILGKLLRKVLGRVAELLGTETFGSVFAKKHIFLKKMGAVFWARKRNRVV